MKTTFIIYVETIHGPATITSYEEFNDLGEYIVEGTGKDIASEWIEQAYGAFGNTVGTHAAPCDLHAAAMDLEQSPEDDIKFVRVEGEVKTYKSGVPDGCVP
jgi:hypothetical protein